MTIERDSKQPLHLVFGGELRSLESAEFCDPSKVDMVGIFPTYDDAYQAWKSAAQQSVDNAMMRYFIVDVHHLLDPSDEQV
jgi:Domain of unknown function (DUF4170)